LTEYWPSCLEIIWKREGIIGALNTDKSRDSLPHWQSYRTLMVHCTVDNITKVTIILKFLFTLWLITVYQRLVCYAPPKIKLQWFNSSGQQRNRTTIIFESLCTQGPARDVPNTSAHEMSSNEHHGAQKLIVAKLVKKYHACYEIWTFTSMLTKVRHW
jgi:hypothetical protein